MASSSSPSSSSSSSHALVVDPFCLRQFTDAAYAGTRLGGLTDPEAFEAEVNRIYRERCNAAAGDDAAVVLVDGYAPFCKHLFVPNFVSGVTLGYRRITEENEAGLRTGYEARRETELPVLGRWFDAQEEGYEPEEATFLDVILYSREQIIAENEAMGETPPETSAPWGIISVKAQTVDYELPMNPTTMLRNALGKDEGGSGVPLDREKYMQSVEFWSQHAIVK